VQFLHDSLLGEAGSRIGGAGDDGSWEQAIGESAHAAAPAHCVSVRVLAVDKLHDARASM